MSNSLPCEVLWYGRTEAPAERVALNAGPLQMIFEAGDLRYVRLGESEVIRRIYCAVRDRNWGTIAGRISDLKIDHDDLSFRVSYLSEHCQGEIDFAWRGEIRGDVSGTVRFSMDGKARSTFLRNRIGCCVLHPGRECAGAEARAVQVDGQRVEKPFPKFIARHCPEEVPFQDLKSFEHEVRPGLWARLDFEGDAFEMEDQRNWIDASFKTFCTPLRLPFPVEIKAGTRVRQSVTLSLRSEAVSDLDAVGRRGPRQLVRLRLTGSTRPMTAIGLGGGAVPLTELEAARIRALNLSHLRVDLDFSGNWRETLSAARRNALAVATELELAIFVKDETVDECWALADLLKRDPVPMARIIVFQAEQKSTASALVDLARKHLAFLNVAIGSGSNAYFTELNRARPNPAPLDFLCYSVNPQVHAFDDASLVETLEAHTVTIESARQFSGGKPIVITPITLKPRFNPDATGPTPPPRPGELPPQVDPRQMSLFGAGWTLGSIKYVMQAGVQSATWYEVLGWLGVMETTQGSTVPEKFQSIPGGVFPMYHVFADVGEFRGGEVLEVTSSEPLLVEVLALRKGTQTRMLLANLTSELQRVEVPGLKANLELRLLDADNAIEAMVDPALFRQKSTGRWQPNKPLELPPFAIARFDLSS